MSTSMALGIVIGAVATLVIMGAAATYWFFRSHSSQVTCPKCNFNFQLGDWGS